MLLEEAENRLTHDQGLYEAAKTLMGCGNFNSALCLLAAVAEDLLDLGRDVMFENEQRVVYLMELNPDDISETTCNEYVSIGEDGPKVVNDLADFWDGWRSAPSPDDEAKCREAAAKVAAGLAFTARVIQFCWAPDGHYAN